MVKNPLAMQETWVPSLGREDPLAHSLDEPLQTRSTDNCTARSPGCRRPEWAPTPRGHWTELTGPVSEGLSAPTGHPHPLAWQPLCPQAQHQDPWHTSSHTLTLVGRTHASRDHQMRGLQSPIHTEPGCGVGERQGGCTHRGPWSFHLVSALSSRRLSLSLHG